MDNTKLIARAISWLRADDKFPRVDANDMVQELAVALEAAEAELTRRDTVIAEAHRVVDEFLDGTSEGVGPLAHVAENAIAAIHEVLAAAPVSLEAVKAAGLPGQIVTLAFEDGVTTFECNLEGCECPEHDNGPAKAGTYVTVRLDSDVRIGLSRVLIITEGDDRG